MSALRRIEVTGVRTPSGRVAMIPIERIVIDETYQRPISPKGKARIEAIAARFDWSMFTPVLVAAESGGCLGETYHLIDGQHRTHAAALAGYDSVPAFIQYLTLEQRAQAFAVVNGDVLKVSSIQIYRAALAAEAPWAVDARDTVAAAGFELMTCDKPRNARRWGEVYAVGLIRDYVEGGQHAVAERALRLLAEHTVARSPAILEAAILRPWMSFVHDHYGVGEARLAGFTRKVNFIGTLATADEKRAEPRYQGRSRTGMMLHCLNMLFDAGFGDG